MSQKKDQPGDVPPDFEALLRPMIEFWSSCCEQATDAGGAGLPAGGESEAASGGAWRRSWLDAASRSMEGYLRSPMFLETMKQHIDALIQAKRSGLDPVPPCPADQEDDAQPPAGDSADTSADTAAADRLAQRLEALGHELSGKLSGVEQRLQAIERRLSERAADPTAGGQAAPPGESGDARSP